MVRIANKRDILYISSMLYMMYAELQPQYASNDGNDYITEIVKCIDDPKQTIFVDSKYRGFFIMVDETESLTPELKLYNGTRVYIKVGHRNGRLLKEFYDTMFKAYPDGDIVGLTVVNSKHIEVLEKRHTRIANLYKLKRS